MSIICLGPRPWDGRAWSAGWMLLAAAPAAPARSGGHRVSLREPRGADWQHSSMAMAIALRALFHSETHRRLSAAAGIRRRAGRRRRGRPSSGRRVAIKVRGEGSEAGGWVHLAIRVLVPSP